MNIAPMVNRTSARPFAACGLPANPTGLSLVVIRTSFAADSARELKAPFLTLTPARARFPWPGAGGCCLCQGLDLLRRNARFAGHHQHPLDPRTVWHTIKLRVAHSIP